MRSQEGCPLQRLEEVLSVEKEKNESVDWVTGAGAGVE